MTDPSREPRPHNPFDASTPPYPAQQPATAPPTGRGGEVNTLATLSVIFAFVFAPAGAVLGHLGLSQIARTGQRGRDRAVVGVTLSYVSIVAAIVALVVWISMGHNDGHRSAPAPHSAPTAPAVPPRPYVAPGDVATLLPTLQETKDLTGNETLKAGPSSRHMSPNTGGVVTPPDCIAVVSSGAAEAYRQRDVRGYYDTEFLNVDQRATDIAVGMDAVSFDDAVTARAQADDLIAQWKRCIADPNARIQYPDGRTFTATFTPPVDAGDGITTMEFQLKGSIATTVRAVAAKANVVVDIFGEASPTPRDQTMAVIKAILAKIPG